MKLVDRKTFLELPNETIFSRYLDGDFSHPMVKIDTYSNDFVYQELTAAEAIEAASGEEHQEKLDSLERGDSVSLDFDCGARDGMFEDRDRFVIWEPADVAGLITRLQETLNAKDQS